MAVSNERYVTVRCGSKRKRAVAEEEEKEEWGKRERQRETRTN